MNQLTQPTAPIIPVIDERLNYLPDVPHDHKAKIDQYNELLEDIYQREVELVRIKSTLTDMRQQIDDEALHLSSTGVLLLPVPLATPAEVLKSDSESEEAENVLSDSSGSATSGDYNKAGGIIATTRRNSTWIKPFVKSGNKKVKRKFGRLGSRHSKVPDAELDADWDYQLEIGRGSKGRHGSEINTQI